MQVYGGKRTIEECNWKAAALLHRTAANLDGSSITTLWDWAEEQEFFDRLSREKVVDAIEAEFSMTEGNSFIVLVSAAIFPREQAVLTLFDITCRVHTEHALNKANDKLNRLDLFSADHLHCSVDQILDTVDDADISLRDTGLHAYLERIRTLTWNVAR
ncbi:MAG: PAS domain-containing protein [Methanomicrobiales archaeon]